jgi:hypothetical protein
VRLFFKVGLGYQRERVRVREMRGEFIWRVYCNQKNNSCQLLKRPGRGGDVNSVIENGSGIDVLNLVESIQVQHKT